ncbi:ribosomal maturation YjgA family protein [Microbacterium halophytorum]|uniref:ribosomal maturation YjgA family protein n=1 Tax=Microbacterium halophytorum TaxID=2067568 RepID=UPI001E58F319|nr:DUF2809 domain-containing protein [Microbacterium halophytorum]
MRRIILAIAVVTTVAAGLTVHALLPLSFGGDFAADALYAVLIYLLVAFVAPRWPARASGVAAFAWCAAVEAFQLTGLPEAWGLAWRPLMLVFGTVFSWWDLVAYAVGVAAAAFVDAAVRGAIAGSRGRGSGTSPS